MWVGDVVVDGPQAQPVVGVAQERAGDLPQGVSGLHDVVLGRRIVVLTATQIDGVTRAGVTPTLGGMGDAHT